VTGRVVWQARALAAILLLLAPFLLPHGGEIGLLGAVVALAALAWAVRTAPDAVRAVAVVATSVRVRHLVGHRPRVPRHVDPDAAGRPRPRAPGLLRPEQTPA
jgi:hypothetical protein